VFKLLVSKDWVTNFITVDEKALRTWAEEPANAKWVLPGSRHILVMAREGTAPTLVETARKKAEKTLARIKRGEDFAKVAAEVSEDPGSNSRGGRYAGTMVENFVEPYRVAYASLAPGQVAPSLVRTSFGFHIIKKDLVDDDARREGYKRAKSAEMTSALAKAYAELLAKGTPKRRAVDMTTAAILGPDALGDESRPALVRLQLDIPKPSEEPPCDELRKLATAQPGTVVTIPLYDGAFYVIGAVHRASAKDPPADASFCEKRVELTPEQIKRLIEELKRKQSEQNAP
jgi:hypothetical protein